MERKHTVQELIDEPTQKLISKKVCRFARQKRCCGEPADLEQEIMLRLVRRCHRFNPQKANFQAFATVVCRSQLLSLLERRCAQRRTQRKEAGSLNGPARGCKQEHSALLDSTCHSRRLGSGPVAHQDYADLRSDLAAVLWLLPALQRQICERLKLDSPTAVAAELGIPRGTLYDHIRQIRERFEQAGLREYL